MHAWKTIGLAVTLALLVLGNLIGVGILALPINTGLAGFWPSVIALVFFGGTMLLSALVLAREAVNERSDSFNYPSLFERHLGRVGKWIAVAMNLLIMYGLATAYLTGGAVILAHLFHLAWPSWASVLALFVAMTAMTVLSPDLIRRSNTAVMVLLFVSFALLIGIGERHVEPVRLARCDWSMMPATAPIVLTAFYFHNIVPTVCGQLKWRWSLIWKTLLGCVALGLVLNILWIQVAIGALPLEGPGPSLVGAFEHDLPATVPLSEVIHSRIFEVSALVFALLAIVSSYVANGLALRGFLGDLLENSFHTRSRGLSLTLVFLPPLMVVLVDPNAFLKSIDLVGGVGIIVLFGMLPSMLLLKKKGAPAARALGAVLLAIFLTVLGFEIAQAAGWLRLRPRVEYWRHPPHYVPRKGVTPARDPSGVARWLPPHQTLRGEMPHAVECAGKRGFASATAL